MKHENKNPIFTVDHTIYKLQRLAGLCHMLCCLTDPNDSVDLEAVGDTMGIVRDCLNQQIEALQSIQWPDN